LIRRFASSVSLEQNLENSHETAATSGKFSVFDEGFSEKIAARFPTYWSLADFVREGTASSTSGEASCPQEGGKDNV
jgi:hypothetical protein